MSRKVLIVGGVAGGASAAARLRRLDETAEIILIEKGPYISYANCGLPYYIGGVIEDRDELMVMTAEGLAARFAIDVRTQHEVLALDPEQKILTIKSLTSGENYQEDFTELILSPGSEPLFPPIPGIQEEGIFTLWTVPDTDRIYEYIEQTHPRHAVVVGGGFIGLEMAENLKHRGLDVSLIEMQNQVMAPVDLDMAQILHQHMRDLGVHLHLNSRVESFAKANTALTVNLAEQAPIQADLVILSLGVRPQTKFLQGSGLDFGPRGHLVVNEHLQTNREGIYAVGDAIEVRNFVTGEQTAIPLAGPANKQGRMVADNIVGPQRKSYKGSLGTAIAKVFELNVASVGMNEKNLQAMGREFERDYAVAYVVANNHAGYYPDATALQIKALFSLPEGKLLGCQIVGRDGVDKRIDVFATVQRFGGTIHDLKELELAYAPPFNSAKDPMNMVGFVAENILDSLVRLATPLHLRTSSGDVVFLDVRQPEELEFSALDGAVNIPLPELRSRLTELDPSKSYVVFCAMGVRSYNAARILMQHGFSDVRVLAGGLPALLRARGE